MQVTNGRVVVSRTVKPADYEGKKVEVELAFIIDEGEDAAAITEHVAGVAFARVITMLKRPETVSAVPAPAAVAVTADASAKSGETAAPAQVTRTTRTPPKVNNGASADPFAAAPAVTTEPTVVSTAPPVTPPPVDRTDAAIRKAIEQKVAGAADRSAMTNLVRDLIAKFTGAPMTQIYTVDDQKRGEFLVELEALGDPTVH